MPVSSQQIAMACSGQERTASLTCVLLVGRDVPGDRRGMAVNLIELEHLRGDHGAERVTLAALRVDFDVHGWILSVTTA